MSCSHDSVWAGMCTECGTIVEELEEKTNEPVKHVAAGVKGRDGVQRFAIAHGDSALRVSAKEAERMQAMLSERLLKQRKLVLVLDLDLTLIHATTGRQLQESTNQLGRTIDYTDESDMFEFKLQRDTYYIKFRPFLRDFMDTVNELFELHMYTMGTKPYAERVAAIIDPNNTLFQSRILSRDACGQALSKDLRRLFPAGDELALVIDDRSDVWRLPDNTPCESLLQIEPFHFFPVMRELNALPQQRQQQLDVSQAAAAADTRLLQMQQILIDLHQRFFKHYDATQRVRPVSRFLVAKRRQVLRGTRIVFSGAYAKGDARRRLEVLRLAMAHGASCIVEYDESQKTLPPDVTHVVARVDQTSKVRAALATEGVYLVGLGWFYESIRALKRLPEKRYPVGKRKVIRGEPRPPYDDGRGDDGSDNDEDDEDDDDDDDDDDDLDPSIMAAFFGTEEAQVAEPKPNTAATQELINDVELGTTSVSLPPAKRKKQGEAVDWESELDLLL